MNLRFKYHFLLPLLARLPQNIAYRLASLSGRLARGEHATEKEIIIQQMQRVFTEKNRDELVQIADYFFGMVEREALDTWFFGTCKTQKQLDRFEKQLDKFHKNGNHQSDQIGDFVTEDHAKKLLCKKTTWFYNQRKADRLCGFKVGSKRFYKMSDLIKFVDDGKE